MRIHLLCNSPEEREEFLDDFAYWWPTTYTVLRNFPPPESVRNDGGGMYILAFDDSFDNGTVEEFFDEHGDPILICTDEMLVYHTNPEAREMDDDEKLVAKRNKLPFVGKRGYFSFFAEIFALKKGEDMSLFAERVAMQLF